MDVVQEYLNTLEKELKTVKGITEEGVTIKIIIYEFTPDIAYAEIYYNNQKFSCTKTFLDLHVILSKQGFL